MVIPKLKALIWVLIFATCCPLFADPGKIAGTVMDKSTGEPLIGANVLVEGTHLGATTDEDGFFYVLNVTPGTYKVTVQYIGYHSLSITEVLVRADLTTKLEFRLESQAIESPTVTVTAERELIQKDLTSTRRVTTREEFVSTPGLEQVSDIFKLRGGLVEDFFPQRIQFEDGTQLQLRDESLKNVHVRGGRGGEILYIVDGQPVTHPIYGGRDVLNLNVQEVEQVELLTGAFSAEYGNAQSGVVNITTRTGSHEFTGGIEYKTDRVDFVGDSYTHDIGSFYFGGPLAGNKGALKFLGVPGEMFYFVSGNSNLTNTRFNNRRTRDLLYETPEIRERQDNDQSLNAKLTWNLTPTLSLTGSFNGSFKDWSEFDWQWINIPDSTPEFSRNTQNWSLRINHVLSKNTYYNLNLGYLVVDYNSSLDGRTPISAFWTPVFNDSTGELEDVTTSLNPPRIDPATGFFRGGQRDVFRDDFTKTLTFKFDIRSQFNKFNLLKAGIQFQYNDLRYVDIQNGGLFLSRWGEQQFFGSEGEDPFPKPPGPFPEFGLTRWVFRSFPMTGAFYVEDKFEQETLIFNAGVRLDWFYKGKSVDGPVYRQQWEDATGFEANWDLLDYRLSPRFGLSFPALESTVFFFSYGHFLQLPELQFFYRDPYTGGFTGNPDLDWEQTILYEFGFTQLISENLALDVKAFQRDISEQVEVTQLLANLGLPVQLYDNKGRARARGIEVELNKRYSNFTSGHLTYTAQWATGFSSSEFENFINALRDIPRPIRETRLDWDIRHQVVANINLQSPPGQHLNALGLKLPDNWNLATLIRFGSGRPYTPGTRDPIEANLNKNSKNLPWTLGIDLKFQKTFEISGLNLDFFADLFNVFNRANSRAVNPWTGKPYSYGDVIQDSQQFYTWRQMILFQDPRQLEDPTHLQMGFRLRF